MALLSSPTARAEFPCNPQGAPADYSQGNVGRPSSVHVG
jgi:hypothetical protein